jgi:tetratricopeptide (TPR) repeat protein
MPIRIAPSLLIMLPILMIGAQSSAEIRYWVDEAGVTHFTDDPDAAPDSAARADEVPLETLRSVWQDGFVGPPVDAGEASFGDDRIARLLRGARADLERGELARADSTLRGVLRLDPRNASAHWSLAALAAARGRFATAERHLRLFLDNAGPELAPWRARAAARLAAIVDERRLADPEHLDGPLELQTVRDTHFRVQIDARLGEVAPDYADRVVGYLREARAEVSEALGVEPLEPLGVVLYGRAAYVRAHAHRFSFQTIGFFDGRIHVASTAHPTESLRGLLFHEYAHAIFRGVTGGDRPYWLNEGLAERIERRSRSLAASTRSERAALRANIELDAWIPLASIAESFSGLDDGEARNAYLQSVVTAGFIHDRTRVEERRRLLRLIGEGFSIDQALHAVMGLDTEGLDAAVRAEILREFPEWTRPEAMSTDRAALGSEPPPGASRGGSAPGS